MKKYIKIISLIIGLAILGGIAYATATTANSRKSAKLPWQGTPNGYYDQAHNVGTNYVAQSRFSFDKGTVAGSGAVVKDSVTGLMWQSEGKAQGTIVWEQAKSYCAGLELGGYADWRLPNIKELSSIADYSKYDHSVDTAYFNLAFAYHWSSTTSASNTSYAWIVHFYNGYSTYDNSTNNNYVICTR